MLKSDTCIKQVFATFAITVKCISKKRLQYFVKKIGLLFIDRPFKQMFHEAGITLTPLIILIMILKEKELKLICISTIFMNLH